MNTLIKNLWFIAASLILIPGLRLNTHAYDFQKYNYIPPFIAAGEAPSVLLICDTSGSMDHFAYAHTVDGFESGNNAVYNSNTVYYGYFDPYAYYRYVKCEDVDDTYARSGFFEENTVGWTDSLGDFHGEYNGGAIPEDGVDNVDPAGTNIGVGNYEWSGNYLNYISMRRADILKRVLMGGRRAPSNFSNLFENAPAGYDTGANVNPLDYLVVGDYLYYGSRAGSTFDDSKSPLPPGPDSNEATEVALGKPDRTNPLNDCYLTPYGDGSGTVTLTFEYYYNDSCGNNSYHRPFYLKFTATPVAISDLPSEAKGERRKLLALKLLAGEQPQGIVQRTGGQVRFGVTRFNRSDNEGGQVLVPVGDTNHLCTPISGACGSVCTGYGVGSDDMGDGFRMNGVLLAINDLEAAANTPLGETLATAVLYFQQNNPFYHNPADFTVSKLWDPFFFNKDMDTNCSVLADEGEYVVCSKGYVIVLTDGEPTSDSNFPGWVVNYNDGGNDGTTRIDDVARYAHITDLRPNDLVHGAETYLFSTVDNTLNIYPVFTFGAGGTLLRSTARNGGFIDKNSDNKPNTIAEETAATADNKEWDFDGDGEADNYFEATSGEEIEASLISALSDILRRAASGSAASIIAGSRSGSGAIFQAIFFPEMQEPSGTRTVAWTGYLHALFTDEYGNMWEDWNGNDALDVPGDRIVQLYWNSAENATKVRFYTSRLPNGQSDPASLHIDSNDPAKNNIMNIAPIWEAGQELTRCSSAGTQRSYAISDPTQRYIFTWVDTNNDGIVTDADGIPGNADEIRHFIPANLLAVEPYFDLPLPADPDYISGADLTDWIRGVEVAGYRSRQIDYDNDSIIDTWRFGDIIYSTPTIVGAPAELLDMIYRDDSYRTFYRANKDRRQVIYVGANDGMLHAFNAGFYDEINKSFLVASGGKTQYNLGEELWAFIPFDLLPHLQALPQIDYDSVHGNHVCFVDLKPRIMDVKFANNTWHTVLVCGMRLGGGEVTVNGDTLKSAYFALDITDPESEPVLLWSYNDTHLTSPAVSNNLGFTTSYPAVVNQYDSFGNIKTFVVVGSGLTTLNPFYPTQAASPYPAKSDRQATLYAIDIETGAASVVDAANMPIADINSYFGDPVAIDLSYKTEIIPPNVCYASELGYVGIGYDHDNVNTTPDIGKIYRIKAMQANGNPEMNPSLWTLSLLCDVAKPVSSSPNVSAAGIKGRFTTDDYRAYITADLSVDPNEENNYIPLVYFGTGEYWFAQDKEDQTQQFFYGIKEPIAIVDRDPGPTVDNVYQFAWGTVDPTHLMDTTSTVVYENGWVDMNGDGAIGQWVLPAPPFNPPGPVTSATWLNNWPNDPPHFDDWVDYLMNVDMTTTSKDHFSKYHGWKIDLVSTGERVVGMPGVLGGIVVFTSYLPSDQVCVTKGDSYLYALHYLTGTAFYEPILDVDLNTSITIGPDTYYAAEKSSDLGEGMGITPTFHAGGEDGKAKAFIQTSTGAIREINVDTVFDVLGPGVHLRSWKLR